MIKMNMSKDYIQNIKIIFPYYLNYTFRFSARINYHALIIIIKYNVTVSIELTDRQTNKFHGLKVSFLKIKSYLRCICVCLNRMQPNVDALATTSTTCNTIRSRYLSESRHH